MISSPQDVDAANARNLRHQMEGLYVTKPSDSLIFVPGLLVGLKILFAGMGIRNVAMSAEEYYTRSHFAGLNVASFAAAEVVPRVCRSRTDVVIESVVTWRGKETQISKQFSEIRRKMGNRRPLLVADYSHAGAIGWPPVSELNADVVCGDPNKWMAESCKGANLGFMWFRSMKLFRTVEAIFAPFYLALKSAHLTPQSRWVDPDAISKVTEWYACKGINRDTMQKSFCENLALARKLSERWRIRQAPRTAMFWLEKAPKDNLFKELQKIGLVWETDEGFRVAARADVLKANNCEKI